MRKKEIKEKFEKLDEQIKSLEKEQESLYEITQFIFEVIGKYTDKPIYRIKKSYNRYGCYGCTMVYLLQYVYENNVKEIETCENIYSAELLAYCDTHFILKNSNNKCFLIDMKKGIITNIPTNLLFSKEMNLTIEGQVLKVCQTKSEILGVKHE